MKVVVIQPWIARGGSEVVALQVAHSLSKLGHKVVVIALYCDYNDLPSFANKLNIKTFPLIGNLLKKNKILFLLFSFPLLLFLALRHSINSDILHPHNAPALWVSVLISKIIKKPVIWWCSEIPKRETLIKQKGVFDYILSLTIGSSVDKYFVSNVSKIIVYSKQTQARVRKIYRSESIVLYCGPDEDFVEKAKKKKSIKKHKDFVLLSVGKLHPQKNQLLYLEVLKKILPTIINTKLILVGDGPWENYLTSKTKEFGIDDKVIFKGFLSTMRLLEEYNNCDLVLFCPIDQSYGLVPLEALLFNKISVVSFDSGIAEVIQKESIGYIAMQNADDFADKIIKAFNNKKKSYEMSKKGRIFVEKALSWDIVAIELEKIMYMVIQN